ncbi:NADP-dependent 3-hydroxy acid dehydrogenase YdfG [Nannocystis exedens]|uniref:NADP-dependent 3-hydroxy acid dehydrogenase YdfG n=1 Tax=Nannocystis exedens TaxID=54 RepID=A0A1I2ILT9_9BACT|nr:oxidoreductase [Nannocystis exedens]PCC68139.1 short-chain dehydrogenase/reductase [Nannocystis exedens]SFF43372.1 NADP-dependent 3-hydroxy acid dehydrogenase YdfG [Nannocystis exedens]
MVTKQSKRVWFITGASRGIGAEIASAALAAGDEVVATARDPRRITERLGSSESLLPVALDVTNEQSVAAAVEAALARFGRIDVLVNNAGYGLIGAVEETSGEDVRRLYETNVFGLLAVTRAVLPTLRKQRSGLIINLSSVGGYRSGPGFGVYCSTKFAVEGLSEALHAELAPLGVGVTVVEPGYFRTEFLEAQSVVETDASIADYADSAGKVRAVAKSVSLRQPGDPVRLARVMVDLSRAEHPPLRLPLGSDAVAAIEAKNAFVAKELDAWRAVAVSTDFPR